MKQIVQNARTGALEIVEVPAPSPAPGQVLVRNHFSVVSSGTEAMSLEFARKSMLGKARSRPDLTRQVLRKLKDEGPLATYRTVMNRLDSPQALGYSCAGVVESVGEGVSHFAPGDRVACAGAGYANHAEFVVIPENLVAKIPETVATEHAAFATIGAIALQGVRIAAPTLGEIAVVIGLGLIGQITVQLLRANGVRVLGVDLMPERVKQALEQGAEWGAAPGAIPPGWKDAATAGYGADFALVTASAQTAAPLQLAAELCRARARVAVVGAMPMELDRRTFYEKELELRMSMSYGPGRYDRAYEEHGYDYPLPFVRWTENRNLQAFLHLIAQGNLKLDLMQPKIRPFGEALETYDALYRGETTDIAALFRYDVRAETRHSLALGSESSEPRAARRDGVGVSFVGAGNYAKAVLLPALADVAGVRKVAVATATGPSARRTAERYGFAHCGTDAIEAATMPDADLVFIATRHDSHAEHAIRALEAGKAVWLEKPAGLTAGEVDAIADAASGKFLVVGYNRRFSSHARGIRAAFANRTGPLAIRYTVSAGAPPRGSWITERMVGGGRVVGEMCHFVDTCQYLVGAPPDSVTARALGRDETDDSVVALLGWDDGSVATIEYLAHAAPELPKERFEASAEGKTAQCHNYRRTQITGRPEIRSFNQDKGQATAVKEVVEAVRAGEPAPMTLAEIVAASRVTFAIEQSIATGMTVRIEG
jgi:predicted dehydrogenase/threonine dehydrogenase-like Zn-dependent dehydrogenase